MIFDRFVKITHGLLKNWTIAVFATQVSHEKKQKKLNFFYSKFGIVYLFQSRGHKNHEAGLS